MPVSKYSAFFARFRSLLALALMIAALSVLSDHFLTADNGWNILRQISVNLCLSIGMTLVILSGGIDLSVGAILALAGAVAAGLLKSGLALIVVSSELPEILALADRVLVMCEGRKTAEFPRAEATPEKILAAALPDKAFAAA